MFKFVARRLKEPSTWAGVITLLTVFGITLSPEQAEALASAGAALVGVLLVFTKESGEKDAKQQEEMDKWHLEYATHNAKADLPQASVKTQPGPTVTPEFRRSPSAAVQSVLAKAATPKPKRRGLVGSLKNR